MEQLMAHAMASSHNQPQHQFHPGQIDMKHFGSPFGQQLVKNQFTASLTPPTLQSLHDSVNFYRPHGIGLHQQALMGNPNMGMGMNPQHPSVSLQIPDPHKVVKQEPNFNKMPPQQQPPQMQNPGFPPPSCQYPMMSPAPIPQNLSKKEKHPVSAGNSFGSERDDPWLNNGNGNGNVVGSSKPKKGKKGKRASEPGAPKKSKKAKNVANFNPLPPPPPPVIPEKEKPFECVTCGRRFTQRIGMLQHQRRHTYTFLIL